MFNNDGYSINYTIAIIVNILTELRWIELCKYKLTVVCLGHKDQLC